MRFVSYNIHRAVGSRGRPSIASVGDALRELEPDVVVLNEIVRTALLADQPARLASMLHMEHAFSKTTRSHGMAYGNALLVRGRIHDHHHEPLPADSVEARSVLFADAEVDGVWFTVGCTHLEPRPTPRSRQLDVLVALVRDVRGCDLLGDFAHSEDPSLRTQRTQGADAGVPFVLAGDLNASPDELRPVFEAAGLELAPPKPTFPAAHPSAAIDHVLFSSHWRAERSFTVAAPVSDHAAFVVDLEYVATM